MTEEELRKQDIESVIRGASFIAIENDAVSWAADKAWKKGYYAGREIGNCNSVLRRQICELKDELAEARKL